MRLSYGAGTWSHANIIILKARALLLGWPHINETDINAATRIYIGGLWWMVVKQGKHL